MNKKSLFNSKKAVNTAFLMVAILLIASCGTMPEVTTMQPVNWEANIVQKNNISHWSIKARLGIQTKDNGGALDVFWSQLGNQYTIRLIAPFGQGAFYIEGNSKTASVRNSQGVTQYAENPATLINENLGVDLPIISLRKWLLGLPDENLPVEFLSWGEQGQIYRLKQAGWTIEMLRYQLVDNLLMPHLFVLQRDDRPELSIRLIIRKWLL